MPLRVLLAGATGYVGSQLAPLLARRARVRCLARDPGKVHDPSVEVARGDLLEPASLAPALAEVDVAYYLVHGMGEPGAFEERDRVAATNFADAARAAGVKRIVYLGGLGAPDDDLSAHLKSRQDVGDILRARSGATVVELRAAVIIGAGSLGFEMVRALTERLPVMVTPRWVRVQTQPIAIRDALDYLVEALDSPPEGGVFEIGGASKVSYLGMMKAYAKARGLRRVFVPVPVLSPRVSSLWLRLVTPLQARVGRSLIEGVRNPTVVRDDAAARTFRVRPMGIEAAMAEALSSPQRRPAAAEPKPNPL